MEPRIFRFFQYIESIFSNFIGGKKIIAKKRSAGAQFPVARSDIKETSNKVAVDQRRRRLPSRLTGFLNLFFKKENFFGSSSSAFASGIFYLFIGFVIGNLFGTFLPAIRIFFSWDGFIVIFLLFFIEFISYIRYQRKNRFFLILWNIPGGYFVKEPIPFTNKKFPLDLEDERRKQPPLNNEVPAVKKGKRNYNKIAFTRKFPFFRISSGLPERLSALLFSNEASSDTTFLERSPPFTAKGYKSFNYFKIGFLLGFFIDAYKVGS